MPPPTGRTLIIGSSCTPSPVMKETRPSPVAWRSIIGAGFALPRDAGLEAGGPSNRAELPLPSAQAGEEVRLVCRRGCRFENGLR